MRIWSAVTVDENGTYSARFSKKIIVVDETLQQNSCFVPGSTVNLTLEPQFDAFFSRRVTFLSTNAKDAWANTLFFVFP